ncbi:MAG: hypothetical protein SOI56_06055 [Eubacteriales bacterium]
MNKDNSWPCPFRCTMMNQYIKIVEDYTKEIRRLRKVIAVQDRKISRLKQSLREREETPW